MFKKYEITFKGRDYDAHEYTHRTRNINGGFDGYAFCGGGECTRCYGGVEPLLLDARPAAVMNDMPLACRQGTRKPRSASLRDAVAIGINTNPENGVVQTNRRATDEELRQARALYLPSIDFRGDTGFEYSDDPATRSGPGDDTEEMMRYEAGLTLTQLLWDGMETKYENLRQESRVLSASHRVREANELTGLAIVEAYLDVMRQRELLRIARQNVAQHISILEQIDDSASAGR